ncbi:MAG: MFS transporter [Acidobacteriota bacterium]
MTFSSQIKAFASILAPEPQKAARRAVTIKSMKPTRVRQQVLAMLFLLSVITYLDRVCISVAAPEMMKDLNMSESQLGLVFAVFTYAYGIFEIPGGWLGDRFGPRVILTRIVVWWSAFTAWTGAVRSVTTLLVIRFLFGAGEAGAYPNCSCVISRWFPTYQRARAQGIVWMASRLGGALTPLLVVPLQAAYGWRAVFYIFSVIGLIWAVGWYFWFRNDPREKPTVNAAELELIGEVQGGHHGAAAFRQVLASRNVWIIMAMYHTFCYGSYWYIAWMPTYLKNAKHVTAFATYAALPFVLGGLANGVGGWASDVLVKKMGLKWGRRIVGMVGVSLAGAFMLLSLGIEYQPLALVVLALGFAASDFMLPNCWATCLDVGKENAGTITGAMNTAGQMGATIMSVAFGYMVEKYGWDIPLIGIALLFFVCAFLWLGIDASKTLAAEREEKIGTAVVGS